MGGWRRRSDFEDVKAFCLFVGHPRSGHTLIGALLDAHPDMEIAHELHSLKYVQQGVSRDELYYLLLSRASWFKAEGMVNTGYKYAVPSQHQGTYSSLQVIGDKRGGGTAHLATQHPELLPQLKQLVGVPVKVIHVTRHPYDNISTLARKHYGGDIDAAIDQYAHLYEGVHVARRHIDDKHWQSISHEGLIDDPESTLRTMCGFLGVKSSDDYLSDCNDIVFQTPSKSRGKVLYSQNHVERIRQIAAQHSSLDQYDLSL